MNIKKILFYLLAVVLGGCVPVATLHPVYTDETVVFEEKLLGIWTDDSDGYWKFTRIARDPNGYYLELKDDEGNKGLFETHLCRIDGKLILDAIPAAYPCSEKEVDDMEFELNGYFFQQLHTFAKVEFEDPNLTIAITGEDKFEELLEESPTSLEFNKVESRLIITDSTEKLQKFIAEYINDERLCSDANRLKRQELKIEEPAEPNQ